MKYGVVYGWFDNCEVTYISNNYENLIKYVLDSEGEKCKYNREHAYVGDGCDLGGEILGVFQEDTTDENDCIAVLISHPDSPVVID